MSLIPNGWILNYAMKYLYILAVGSIVALTVVFSSCKNVLGPSGQADIVFPASNVSYTKQVLPLFSLDCAYSGCHDDQTAAGNLDLTTYNGLISATGVVIAQDTVHSILVQVIEGKGYIMPPPPAPLLNNNQIQGLKTWIMEGLKYN